MSPKMPDTPYTGMPALRRYKPSVAPVLIVGITGNPGHISLVIDPIADKSSGVNGDGTDGVAGATLVILILLLSMMLVRVFSTSSTDSPGRTRQLIVA